VAAAELFLADDLDGDEKRDNKSTALGSTNAGKRNDRYWGRNETPGGDLKKKRANELVRTA